MDFFFGNLFALDFDNYDEGIERMVPARRYDFRYDFDVLTGRQVIENFRLRRETEW